MGINRHLRTRTGDIDSIDEEGFLSLRGRSDKTHAIAVFSAQNEELRRTVPLGRLLFYELGDGWDTLRVSRRADAPPCPQVNRGEDFVH